MQVDDLTLIKQAATTSELSGRDTMTLTPDPFLAGEWLRISGPS